MFELKGRVALVTGAGRGIGIGIAGALAQQGALVAVNDLREDRAQRSVDAIKAQGCTAISAAFDVTDYDAVAAGIDAITTDLGPVDIVVNNAGIPPGGIPTKPFALSDRTDWHRFVDVNLFGVLNTVHTTVGGMCDRGWGRIVTISSEAARFGMDSHVSIYGAAKAGAVAFSKHLALEVAAVRRHRQLHRTRRDEQQRRQVGWSRWQRPFRDGDSGRVKTPARQSSSSRPRKPIGLLGKCYPSTEARRPSPLTPRRRSIAANSFLAIFPAGRVGTSSALTTASNLGTL